MFQDIIVEEEGHLDTFRTELQNLIDYGEKYLALQSAAGSSIRRRVSTIPAAANSGSRGGKHF